jgi:hypothetical protein
MCRLLERLRRTSQTSVASIGEVSLACTQAHSFVGASLACQPKLTLLLSGG